MSSRHKRFVPLSAPIPAARSEHVADVRSKARHQLDHQVRSAPHPLLPAYDRLARIIPQAPRDPDGHVDATYARGALWMEGIDTISVDGFAELLARCDTSVSGFPSFDDFLLCLSRPHGERMTEQSLASGGGWSAPTSSRVGHTQPSHLPTLAPSHPELGPAHLAYTQQSMARAAVAAANAAKVVADAASVAVTAATMERSSNGHLPEDLARIYATGARLHAGYLQPGLARGANSTEGGLPAEVLARVQGPPMAYRGTEGYPDGYRLDMSGSYLGILPGLEQHHNTGHARSEADLRNASVFGKARHRPSHGRPVSRGLDGLQGGAGGAVFLGGGGRSPMPDESLFDLAGAWRDGSARTRTGAESASGAVLSDRRAYHVARGDAVVLRPGSAGPAV